MCTIDAAEALQDIPVLIEEYLRSLTFGVYQLSYFSDHVSDDGGCELFGGKINPDNLHTKIQSWFVSSKSYYLWIRYDSADTGDPVLIGCTVGWIMCACRLNVTLV